MKLLVFVDDGEHYEIYQRLQSAVDSFGNWFRKWRIEVNPEKSAAVLFKRGPSHVLITLGVIIFAKRPKHHLYPKQTITTSQIRNATQEVKYNGLDLNGELRKSFFLLSADSKQYSNTLCSPLSALLPLAKLALGAQGESLEELLDAIGVPEKLKIHDFYKPLLTRLRYLPGVKLDIASRLYVSTHAHLQHDFKDAAEEVFDSSVDKIDFTFPSYAAEKINSWIYTQTNGIIKDMLEPSDIASTTSLILVNAVYFNGQWKIPFQKVSNVTFYYPTNRQKNIEMMMKEDQFNYTISEALASKIISIPYAGGAASLVVVSPEANGGLAALLAVLRLSSTALADALMTLSPAQVKLTMPKFKVHDQINLGPIFRKMGLETIFDERKSGLKKIVRGETLYMSKAKHKCFIDVNEFGTEAAASTATVMVKLSNKKPIEFLVDHPFLYFILVNDQQLFSGTYVNPDSHA